MDHTLQVSPSEETTTTPLRATLTIKAEWCKGCGFCIEFCPSKCLAFSDAYNEKGYHPPVLTDPRECSGCNLCGMMCPEFAIWAVRNNKKSA